ncbi:MAG: collagen-like protein, partial [Clostridiales bacterium]|nr:collagen-like protein [Clostridiales bacterium]
ALSACMALGTMSVAACSPNKGNNGGGNTGDTVDKSIMRVYEAYAKSAEANGDDVMDYDEWYADLLANAKGEKGDKGDKGDTGAQGEKGDKGDDGEKGEDGAAGKDGNTWLVGTTAPTQDVGKDGDLYLDYTTWNVYHKVSGEWQLLGNIKGADGSTGDGGSQGGSQGEVGERVVKDFGSVTISASGTQELDLTGVEAGIYYLVAETSVTPASGILSSTTDNYKYDMYAPLKGEYKSAIIVKEDTTTQTTLTNSSASELTASVKLVEYVAPVIKAGEEIDVPMMYTGAQRYMPVQLDAALLGKTVKVTIKFPEVSKAPGVIYPKASTSAGYASFGAWNTTSDKIGTGIYSKELDLSKMGEETSVAFRSQDANTEFNATVKFEIVES